MPGETSLAPYGPLGPTGSDDDECNKNKYCTLKIVKCCSFAQTIDRRLEVGTMIKYCGLTRITHIIYQVFAIIVSE